LSRFDTLHKCVGQTDGRTPADGYTALIRNIYIFIHHQMVAAHRVKKQEIIKQS